MTNYWNKITPLGFYVNGREIVGPARRPRTLGRSGSGSGSGSLVPSGLLGKPGAVSNDAVSSKQFARGQGMVVRFLRR